MIKFKAVKKIDAALAVITIAAFIAIVWFMSYGDLNSDHTTTQQARTRIITSEYYIDTSARPEIVPDDSRPITIFTGKIYKARSGKHVFKHQGIQPTTFAQRQVNLMFRITDIPTNYKPIIKLIEKQKDLWTRQGNDIIALFVDYRPKNPNFATYEKFLTTLRGTPKTGEYHVIPSVDMSWISNKSKADYIKLKDPASAFLVLGKYKSFAQQAKKLKNIGYAFRIKLPANYEPNTKAERLLLDNKYFGSAMKTLNEDSVLPEEKSVIKLWPSLFSSK